MVTAGDQAERRRVGRRARALSGGGKSGTLSDSDTYSDTY